MKRNLLVGGLCLAAVFSAAHLGDREFAAGTGRAVSREDRAGQFSFRIHQAGTNPAEGRFELTVETPRDGHRVNILMRQPRMFEVNSNAAIWRGPSVLRVRTRNGERTVEGALEVRVVDNGQPEPNRVDTLAVHFDARDNEFDYHFAGAVRRGNIEVGHRAN